MDPILLSPLKYELEKMRVVAETHVYKFADVASIRFQCNIKLCNREIMGQCDGIKTVSFGPQLR